MPRYYAGSNAHAALARHDWAVFWIGPDGPAGFELERVDRLKHSPDADAPRMADGYFWRTAGGPASDLGFPEVPREDVVFVNPWPGYEGPARTVLDHHFLHAASAFFPSPFSRAAVLCVDAASPKGSSGAHVQSTWVGEGNSLRPVRSYVRDDVPTVPDALGMGRAYAVLSSLAGLEEGAFMGLAAWGDPSRFAHVPVFDPRPDGHVVIHPEVLALAGLERGSNPGRDSVHAALSRAWSSLFGLPPSPRPAPDAAGLPTRPYADMAARVQLELEKGMVHAALVLSRESACQDLCLAGGVALNIDANAAILASGAFRRVFVQPAAGDAGLAVGAAYWARHGVAGVPERVPWGDSAAWGREYSAERILDALRAAGDAVRFSRPDVVVETASALARGELVAWFQGRSEFGPRALGHRSLLGPAWDPSAAAKLNAAKRRHPWRPIAPAVALEDAPRWFDPSVPSPFMTLRARGLPLARAELPSALHVDGTARPQTVAAGSSNPLRAVLERLGSSGFPSAVLNTSLNGPGEPLVETPEQALAFLARAPGVRFAALGPWWVEKAPMA